MVQSIHQYLGFLTLNAFPSNVHGWLRGRSVHTAVTDISGRVGERLSFDIVDFFGSINTHRLARKVNRLDPLLWQEIVRFLPEKGIPTGFRFSPLLGNLYLLDIDCRFPIVRYADNIMIVGDDPMRIFQKVQRHLADIDLACHKIEVDPDFFCKQPLPGATKEGGDALTQSSSRAAGIAPTNRMI